MRSEIKAINVSIGTHKCVPYNNGGFMQRELPKRKHIRLKNFDYSQAGYYFITICVKNGYELFGEILNSKMNLNEYGNIAKNELLSVPSRYENVQIDKFIIMPNHIHMIVVIHKTERINPFPTRVDIPNIIGKYKAGVTRTVGNAFMRSDMMKRNEIWQKRYHDRIIRDEEEYNRIWKYIDENPLNWDNDEYFELTVKIC
jgi:REP element-mobilizing transposase RayT